MISGLDMRLWVSGESMTDLNISGLDIISLDRRCCISIILAEPIPRLAIPGRPPMAPIPNGWEAGSRRKSWNHVRANNEETRIDLIDHNLARNKPHTVFCYLRLWILVAGPT